MTMSKTVLIRGSIAALAVPLGLFLAHTLPGPSNNQPVTLSTLSGRHLQPPWWEAITHRVQPSGTMTYVVPAVVLFATDSSTITSRGQTVLRAMKPRLVGATSIAIAGCTDDVGGVDSPSNIKLSWARALAARNALVALGLHQGIFHLSALADTHPVPEIRGLDQATVNALNRRIIITVTREAQG